VNKITLDSFICYNWMPMVADHCIDTIEDFYRSAGVSRLHTLPHVNPREVEGGDIIFVKTDYLYNGYFQKYVFPQIKNQFVLISGISSYHLGSNGDTSYMEILESPNLIKWHCTNPPDVNSDKIIPLPIGFQERERVGGNQDLITDCFKNKIDFSDKKDKILLPYHAFNTNPQRKMFFELLSNLSFVEVQDKKLSWHEYIKLLDKYKFIICLEGSGPDVHRNYESLLVNSIPINIKNVIQTLFDYHNLPGIFLDSWTDLTDDSFKKLCRNVYDFNNVESFLKIGYHADLIKNCRNGIK